MKKIVYVTGCLGFIGSYVTRECLKRGWFVRGIDKLTYASNPLLLEEFNTYKNFVFEQKDINNAYLYLCKYNVDIANENKFIFEQFKSNNLKTNSLLF